jgi:succinoglycan biosynthesis protein ExoA
LSLACLAPAIYALFVVAASAITAAKEGLRSGLWYVIVLPCIHFGWGTGFILGFLKLTKNITAQTGR